LSVVWWLIGVVRNSGYAYSLITLKSKVFKAKQQRS